MAQQIITITLTDLENTQDGERINCPVNICISTTQCEDVDGSMSLLAALALRQALPAVMQVIGSDIADRFNQANSKKDAH
ncbi:hypothetical protein FNI18_06125 [Salmonella enterica subsp. salamae]|nr:hypothetical protein [Salmonella enterica subsp. salamae]